MKITITADRMIDLPWETLEEWGVVTMSCYVNMGGKSYEDLIDITPQQVFDHLAATGEIAKTAAKPPQAYYDMFLPYTGEGRGVVHFAASSGISAICGYSMQAAERLPNVFVVDTCTLSCGIALLVEYARELIAAGETDAKTIAQKCKQQTHKIQGSFVIDSLECLHKGGRCSSLQYFGANLLKIKPVIALDKITGKMATREKCRGSLRRALADYIRNTFAKYPNPDLRKLYIVHYCLDPDTIQFFVDTVASYHTFDQVVFGYPGCNCAIHSGVDTFGMFYATQ